MTERVDIANLALSWLGAEPITSFEDPSNEARQMATNYTLAVNATLESYEWSFAMKRFVPALLEDAPPFGYTYAYKIPHDILRVISVDWAANSTNKAAREQADWVVESGQILTNSQNIYCRGIRDMEDEGAYSPLFVMAVAAQLAMLTALHLTASNTIEQAMLRRYDFYLTTARNRDAMQGSNKRLRNRMPNEARVGGGRFSR